MDSSCPIVLCRPPMFEARDFPGRLDRVGLVCLAIMVIKGADLGAWGFHFQGPSHTRRRGHDISSPTAYFLSPARREAGSLLRALPA
jgi:hypothetical protein